MIIQRIGRSFSIFMLVVLFMAACQLAPATPALQVEPSATSVSAEPTVPQSTPTGEGSAPPVTGGLLPEGWQTLADSVRGYSVAYPEDWQICQETKYSRVFCVIQQEPDPQNPPLRLYISVLPQDYSNSDAEAYNFTPIDTIRDYMAIQVGESLPKVPNTPRPEYFTYNRLPDRVVAGWTALVIENDRVWDFPAGTKDRVVFLVTEGTTYNLGMYYRTPEELATFEQILDSFQMIP